MREMTDVIFFAVPSSSLLAVRKPAPVASSARMSSKLMSQSPGFVFWFSYSSTLMRRAASVTGDAYMIRYFVLSTSLSMSLFNDRSTASRYWHALSYRLPSM